MVKLTEYEAEMLSGAHGPLRQKAMENIVAYAVALGADELCEVSKATLFMGAHEYLDVLKTDNYEKIFSKMYMCSDETIPLVSFDSGCFSQTCAAPCDQYRYKELHLSREFFEKNKRYLEATKEAGVSIAGSCTPYFTGWIPIKGEHFVTTESSNVLMCNSVFGARGNSDGLEAAVWSAVCGRTPKWGCHTDEGRLGNTVVQIECPSETAVDWDLIGYTVGRLLPPHGRPVLEGKFKRPDIIRLKQCFAAMATTSGAEICHIVGVTPEANTLEQALGGGQPEHRLTVDREACRQSYDMLCCPDTGKIDYVTLGCPHYNLQEVREAAMYLRGKRVHKGVELIIWTDFSTREMASQNGYTDWIEQAGGMLMTSGCPLVIGKRCYGHAEGIAADGAKQAHYLRSETSAPVYYSDMRRCIEAAVSGEWREEMRYDI